VRRQYIVDHRDLLCIIRAVTQGANPVPAYELAQLNVGVIRAPMDSPVMAEFAATA